MRQAGATEANIAAELAKLPPDEPARLLELGEDDEGPAIGLFCALDTQWHTAGLAGVRTGLNYAAIEPTARLLGIAVTPRTFLDLKIMEHEALKVQAERLART